MSARHLLSNARNGNFEAAVQVFLNYRDGAPEFEKNEKLAREAFENIELIFKANFYLNELTILNFKKISDLKINFHQNLTVFIGENGAGKTTLLRGIQKNLSWFSAFILKENTNGERIIDPEINNQAKENGEVAYVNCSFRIGVENRIDGQLIREPQGITTDLRTEVMEYRKFGKNIRELLAYQKTNLPLFMFYDIERFKVSENRKNLSSQENVFYQFDGYEKSSKSRVTLENLIDWLAKLLKISNEVIENSEKLKIESQIDSLLKAGADNKDNPLNELYEDLVSLIKLYPNDETKNASQKAVKSLEKIFRKIYPDLIRIQLINNDDGEDKIGLQLKDEIIFLHQFSDGQRVLFGLLGDITRRLMLLNPVADDPLLGNGVVLIDEVELHLHPSWQQKIILILRESFPNIQFIVTTHSPHVLSTVDKKEIRIIKNNLVEQPNFQTKGVTSATILEQIMDSYSVPQVEESQWITEYLSLIQIGEHESQKGVALFQNLIAHFGENHPQLIICRQQKKLFELKKLTKRNNNEKTK